MDKIDTTICCWQITFVKNGNLSIKQKSPLYPEHVNAESYTPCGMAFVYQTSMEYEALLGLSVRIVNQTISSVLAEWDPIADADVYKIEQLHKLNIWTRVYWGSKPSAQIGNLDENFCYKFRISALKHISEDKGYSTLATSNIITATTLAALPSTIHLFRAIKKGQAFLVKRIINRRADLLNIPSPNGYYPLANAIICGENDIIDIILCAGANVHIGNRINGTTPLQLAFYYGHITVAKVLLNKNAKINATDCIQLTAAHYAIIGEQFEMLKFAVENKCDLEATDICGWTLLLRAVAMDCNLNIIKFLVNNGANLHATDKCGLNSLDIAAAVKNDDILKYLRSK